MTYSTEGSGLGRRQHKMITDMATYGEGRYPPGWRVGFEDVRVLESLRRREMVMYLGKFVVLTDKGWEAARKKQ